MNTKKINIIGTSGSGKSTFARSLAKDLNIPCIEMDQVFWGPDWYFPSDEEFFPKLEKELSQEAWVLDGNYTRTIPIKWKEVDLVIWVDRSFPMTMFQSVKRAVTRSLHGKEIWPDTGNTESFKKTFFSKDSVLLWSLKTYFPNKKRNQSYFHNPEFSHIKFIKVKNYKDFKTNYWTEV